RPRRQVHLPGDASGLLQLSAQNRRKISRRGAHGFDLQRPEVAYRAAVQFSPDLRDDVLAGAITLSYRLWTRPKVKMGGRYRVGPGTIEVDDIELVPFSSVTAADLERCGESDLKSL